jgi:hypothetical protein
MSRLRAWLKRAPGGWLVSAMALVLLLLVAYFILHFTLGFGP